MTLAVENLPRTCLCRTADEMNGLLRGTGVGAVFDTNHSLRQPSEEFLSGLVSETELVSLHISDYDFIDERHRLPGDGVNNWNAILEILEKSGYNGPLMYEVPRQPRDREPISFSVLVDNMRKLSAGLL